MFLSPSDIPTFEPDGLQYLSDETLWTIARDGLPTAAEAWMQILLERRTIGSLSEEEYHTLVALLEHDRRLMRHKAEAAMVLIERGYQLI